MKTVTKSIKSMTPRSLDTGTGPEPDWKSQPEPELRKSRLTSMFNWYNYYYSRKEAKDCIVDWLNRTGREKEGTAFNRVPETAIVKMAIGWMCRANLLGLVLLDEELAQINEYIATRIDANKKVKQVTEVVEEIPAVNKPNIQDRLREKVIEAAGELEGMYDEMICNGCKMSADYKPLSLMRSMNISPQMVGHIREVWNRRVAEIDELLAGKDAQLTEGYDHLGKVQIRNLLKFAEQVLSDCDSYVQIKKADRKPRAKKAVSPEKLTAKFKYLREFEDLKLKSEPVTKLVGASEAWLYDTAKRKLIHVVADNHMGTFTVKGSSIVGFDTATTVQKTLRKPAEQIKTVISGGKPAARKAFKDIKATEVKFNGRSNENLILLKVW